jgi:hypothetical protein
MSAEDDGKTYWIEYDTDDEAAAGTCRNVLAVRKLAPGDFESVAAGTWVVVYTFGLIPGHVLDLDFVVVGSHWQNKDSVVDESKECDQGGSAFLFRPPSQDWDFLTVVPQISLAHTVIRTSWIGFVSYHCMLQDCVVHARQAELLADTSECFSPKTAVSEHLPAIECAV